MNVGGVGNGSGTDSSEVKFDGHIFSAKSNGGTLPNRVRGLFLARARGILQLHNSATIARALLFKLRILIITIQT